MKKFLSVLFAVLMLMSLCSVSASAEDKEPITIRIMWWGDTARHEKYNKFVDAFEEAYPWITVERESATWNDYWSKLPTMVAGGNAPEVMGMHPQFASDYANRGALLDLQGLVDKGILETQNIPQAILDGGTIDGKLSMISMGVTVSSNFLNETLCEEVGFEYPKDREVTWAEFAELAKEFRQKALDKGIDAYLTTEDTGYPQFQYLCRSNGRDLYTEDGNLWATAEDVAEWFAYWKDLRDNDAIPDAATTVESFSLTLEQNLFCTHKVAMTIVPVNQLWQYCAQLPEEKITPVYIPIGNNGVSGAFLEGAHWAISSAIDEKHQEAAGLLLNFIANREEAAQYMLMDQGVPCNTKMAEYITPMLDEPSTVAVDFVTRVTAMVTHGFNYAPKGANAIDTVFRECRELVSFDEMTPEEAGKSFVEQAQAIIDENR